VKDSSRFAEMGGHAFVYWKDSMHLVKRQESPSGSTVPVSAPTEEAATSMVWAVSDPEDDLFEQIVPEEIANDKERFFNLGGHHLVRWHRSLHMVQKVERPQNLGPCGGDYEAPCEVSMTGGDIPSWSDEIIFRYEKRPLGDGAPLLTRPTLMALFSCTILLVVASAAMFRRLPRRSAERSQEFEREHYPGSPLRYARLEAGGTSPQPHTLLFNPDASPEVTMEDTLEDTIETSPARLRPSAFRAHRDRKEKALM